MAPTRKSYTACYKLGVVKYAAENGNRAAGRKFGVNEKLVRNWRKAEVTLTEMKTTKKANRGLKARWPQLEERVHKWVIDQRAAGRALSSVQLRLHAQVVAKAMNINDFAGGPSWCHRFMQRNRLSFRARTTMSQKPPADFRSKVDSFREFIEKHVSEHSVTPDHIISMDEVPLTFVIPMGRSVAEKRQKSVNIVTPGHEKSHCTVVLACCGNGAKLPPMVIFKRKTMPKIQSPSVTVAVNEKGWMDEEMMNLWLTKCYIKRPDGFFRARKALLVMDSMRAHITPQLKHKLKVFNSIPAIIPGDLTKILQPLDISVNRSFKAVLRNLWEQWMMDGEHSFTATGRMRHANFLDVIGWIDKAWASVTTESILSGFRKAGIIGTATDDDSDVWLAALRETDKQDSAEQHLICEDHFLPEDISTNGVGSDAIPIMPPLLDGPLGMISPWGAESSEEEDPWAAGGGCNDDGDYADEGGDEGPVRVEPPPAPEPPAVDPPQKDPGVKKTLRPKISGGSLQQKKEIIHTKTRQDVSLGLLTQRFLEMLLVAPDCTVDLRQVTVDLKTRRRRVYDITNVLEGISLLKKQSANKFKWIGSSTISSFLWKSQQKFQRELDNLKLVEDTLDTFIKSCAQQLFEMTDNMENAPSAYVTHEDIRRLGAFQEQTVLVVKAPEETKLEVPAPKEDSIQVHLKGEKGPIMVLTCDIGTGDTTTDKSNHFLTLEESRIKTATLHTESSSQQSAVQSA